MVRQRAQCLGPDNAGRRSPSQGNAQLRKLASNARRAITEGTWRQHPTQPQPRRPLDRSLAAYKAWMRRMVAAVAGGGESATTGAEWEAAWRDQRDYAAMADIQNAVSLTDQLDYTVTAADLAILYGPTSQCDPYHGIIIAQVDGVAVAFGVVLAFQEISGTRVYFPQGRVLPVWRRKGIGRAILHHNERRLRAIAASHPLDGPRTFLTYAADTAVGTVALLTQEGYQPVRHYYHMLRDSLESVPDAPLPDGLEVRSVLPEHYRLIWEADQEAFQDHWGYFRATEDDYRSWLKDRRFDPTLWRIAWDGDQVAGQVRSFIDAEENDAHQRRRGYTEYISVRRPWRKRGVARALIAQSLAPLQARGVPDPRAAFSHSASVGKRLPAHWQ